MPVGDVARRARPAFAWIRDPAGVVVLLAVAWCLATLTFVVAHSVVNGLTFAGPYAGYFPADQLRYLAWIREAGLHALIADPYRAGAAHLYLHPVFLISGLLWRAGLSVQAAYLIWTPAALGILIWGYARFATRFLTGWERAASLALGLLYLSPLVPALDYGGIVDKNGAYNLIVAAGHGVPYWQAWGYLPTLIGLGLMPLFLLRVEAFLAGDRASGGLVMTALAGVFVAWLHPWGGIELAVIVFALLALRRIPAGSERVAALGLAVVVPLIYYAVIARRDSAWSLGQLRTSGNAPLLWPLVVAYGPLVLIALPAIRRPREPAEQILALWPVATLLVYAALGPDARAAALEGLSLPLSIMAVRGWRRLRLPAGLSYAALFLAIVPGAFYSAHTFHDTFHNRYVPFALAPGEQRAVNAIERLRGNVLATRYLAPALPALAGRLGQTSAASEGIFDGRVSRAGAERLIDQEQISVVVSDCLPGRADLDSVLRPLGFQARRYGCARIYER